MPKWRLTLEEVTEAARQHCIAEHVSCWVYLQHNGKPMFADCHPSWGWGPEAASLIGRFYVAPNNSATWKRHDRQYFHTSKHNFTVTLTKPSTLDMLNMVEELLTHDRLMVNCKAIAI